ncbi:MAG: DUF4248 domain-containing protein [Bacteroidaceae bacterium]|nr:DUF4248 domain-containing protein [Bacteroidaceae bacterium]
MNPPPRFTPFGQLAMRYYPDRSYKHAIRLFREELRITRGLLKALKREGYNDRQRVMTRRQVKVIEAFLGEAG